MKLQCNQAFHKYGVPGLEAWALRHAGIFHLSVTNFLRKCQCHSTLPAPPWHPLQQPVQSRCSMNFLVSLRHKTHDTSCLGFTRVTITSSGQSKVSKLPRAFRDMPGKNKKVSQRNPSENRVSELQNDQEIWFCMHHHCLPAEHM